MVRHVLLLQFNDSISSKQLYEVKESFLDLEKHIPGIVNIEWGKNSSPEELNDNFDYCVNIVFVDEEARNIYLTHPAHKELQNFFVPFLEKIIVFDYFVE